MINLKDAIAILLKKINNNEAAFRANPPVILHDYIKEYSWGWLIPYDSKDFIENGNAINAYMGNVPIFVDKFDGTAFFAVILWKIQRSLLIIMD